MTSPTAAPPAGPIDPRIRARRIEVQRDVGRRRLRRLAVSGAVVAVAAGLWGVALTPLFDVDHVRVAGADHTGTDVVIEASGIDRGAPMLTADLGAAAEALARLPWVATVDVSRQWPGTVRVKVVERRPTAAIPVVGGGWVLLDAEGRQLAVQPDEPTGVPRVEVRPVTPVLGETLDRGSDGAFTLARTAPIVLLDRLVLLRPAADKEIEGVVRLADGHEAIVRFGPPDRAEAKWLALLTMLDEVDPAGVVGIDVRVPSAPVVQRGCAGCPP